MKKIPYIAAVIIAAVIVLLPCTAQSSKKADIFFTHDTHSSDDRLAKAKNVIDDAKKQRGDVFVFDAGDFSMGTLYQTVFASQAVELRSLGMIGTDVTTLGNHEFDYGSEALGRMLDTARTSGDSIPFLTECNIDWASSKGSGPERIRKALNDYGSRDYIMVARGGLHIAVIGVFGKNALFCAPTCQLSFLDPVESVRKTVEKITRKEKADMIVCISHGGTSRNASKSEDEILAEHVPELDVIVSGHSHTYLENPIVHGRTLIISCGEYAQYLGNIELEQEDDGRWKPVSYRLVKLDGSVPSDPEMTERLHGFENDIDREYFSLFGYTGNQTLCEAPRDLNELHETGYLMADSYIPAVEHLQTAAGEGHDDYDGVPVDVSIIPSGVVRGTYCKGPVKVRDVYESFSLGTGPDGIPGYPLVSVWLTGKDLKTSAEVDASLGPVMDTAFLFMSGLSYTYNPRRIIFDRVTDVYLVRRDGTEEKIVPDRLYHVVSDIYTGRMLGGIKKMTKGLIVITPRNRDGSPVKDIEKNIIYTGRGELKGWQAIAYHLEAEKTISELGTRESLYKTAVQSFSPAKLFSHPSKFACILYSLVIVVLAVIVLIVTGIVKLVKKAAGKAERRQ
jgi:5'-nucleotidase/UDP-sugar diphosphatase